MSSQRGGNKGGKNQAGSLGRDTRGNKPANRKEKNIFPYALKRIYRVARNDDSLRYDINEGCLKDDISIVGQEIKIKLFNIKVTKKTELMKFFYLLTAYFRKMVSY